MNKMMMFIVLTYALVLTACNTVHGLGKDLEKAGEAVQKSTN